MNKRYKVPKYIQEYVKDNGHLFTIIQMAEFLNLSYSVTRDLYQRTKSKYVPASCKEVAALKERPFIEEYKQVFQS